MKIEQSKTRRRLTTGAVALGALIGSGAVANAVTSQATNPTPAPSVVATPSAPAAGAAETPATNEANEANEAVEPNEANEVHGHGGNRAAHEAQEATDGTDAALLARAKITPEQATAAAIAVAPGTADVADIHDRGGVLSYKVRITTATGEAEVTVDATTGVATVENEASEANEGNEQNETSEATPTAPAPAAQ